jgi:hypothetical protein
MPLIFLGSYKGKLWRYPIFKEMFYNRPKRVAGKCRLSS